MVAASWKQRLSSYFATCLFWFCVVLAVQVALSSFLVRRKPEIALKAIEGHLLRLQTATAYAPETAFLSFDLQADLRPILSGTIRQVYVYVTAEAGNASSCAVLWDYVVGSERDAVINLSNQRAKYPLRAFPGETLRGVSVTLRLHYMVMPYIGIYHKRAAEGSARLVILNV
ncbi:hypothetical protein CCYA_CCYA04G1231 [Cyanidiococcus yangmingshanensis]|nr:hypothetical protein CCYA_CCYA04G1231 [Cyanidiococcus yangmingshanensis]